MLKRNLIKNSLLLLLGVALAGCAAGTFVKPDGTTDKPVWPAVNRATFDQHKGIFPNMENLQNVKAGMTKDQMYALLGRPHYTELWGVREWNFLFHFHTPNQGENDVTTCQYKILYDEHGITRSFYWKPIIPAEGQCPPRIKKTEKINISADALFRFDGGAFSDLNPEGKRQLDRLAEKISDNQDVDSIDIKGYTDYLGDEQYNLRLSEQRAQTVRRYLIDQGVNASLIQAEGLGESHPVKTCEKTGNKQALIACLQPNRRVEVTVETSELPKQ